MQQAGVKVLRTWVCYTRFAELLHLLLQHLLRHEQGFNAINATELPGALQSNLTYYQAWSIFALIVVSIIDTTLTQLWNSSDWLLNEGPQGLQRLDNVIATAVKYDIKVIVAFTNNW